MFFLKYTRVIFLAVATRCYLLVDENNPQGLRISEYCPKMAHCEEGTHVLCMYYDPIRIMGPACSRDAHNVTVTEDFKEDLLEIVNEMRRKVALGEEVGKDNQPLPRAYGMQRLSWDDELALFAQIWANQCTMRHDLCRATKKFFNPGQLTSVFRFTYPDWQVITTIDKTPTEKYLTDEKVILAMRKALRNAYKLKKLVTKDMINNYPDFKKLPELESSRIYLTVVDGRSTHVGCGVSAFSDFYGQVKNEDVMHNVVEIVCNFAGQPVAGNKVYETEKPKSRDFSSRCGCPPGFMEDNDCFCIEISSRLYTTDLKITTDKIETCRRGDRKCRPTVVLVPIFQMEDAPPSMLYNGGYIRSGNSTTKSSINMPNIFTGAHDGMFATQAIMEKPMRMTSSDIFIQKQIDKIYAKKHNFIQNVRKRYFDGKSISILPGQGARRSKLYVAQDRTLATPIPPTTKRASIFTRVSKFKLPAQNEHHESKAFWGNLTINIKQVRPRKDFSKLQDLVSAYLKEKNPRKALSLSHNQISTLVHSVYKRPFIQSIAPNSKTFNHNSLVDFKKNDTNPNKGDSKLLHLLDSLEHEMQRTDLNRGIKEMVDAKIRKIYGNVVSDKNMHLTSNRSDLLDSLISRLEKKTRSDYIDYRDRRILSMNREENDPTSTPKFDIFLKRNQNAISNYDRPSYKPFELSPLAENTNIYDSFIERGKKGYAKDDKLDYNYKRPSGYQGKNNDDLHGERKISRLDKLKYIQEKQDDLEKKIQSIRNLKRRYEQKLNRDSSRMMRPVFIPRTDPEKSRSTSILQNFYVPDRAKFLHSI